MLTQRAQNPRSSTYDRSSSEGLVDLHVYVIPPEQWRNHLSSVLNQLITDSVSVGYIRIHPESVLSDLRKEIDRQLGFDSLPRDFVFLRCLGRSFTQVKRKQEHELKAKYFMPPHTYSPELYVVDASTANRFPTSSQSSRQSFQGDYSSRAPLPPPAYPTATRPSLPEEYSYKDRDNADELLRQKEEEGRRRRQREAEEEEEEEEKTRRRRMKEEEEEDERTRRLIDDIEMRRRQDIEDRRKMDEEDDLRRMRKLEEEEEEDRIRMRKLMDAGRRGNDAEEHDDQFSRPRTPSPTPRQTTIEKHEIRDTWKRRFIEEKKRTPPRDEKTKALKEELDNINRKIIDQMENIRDSGKKVVAPGQNSIDKVHIMKLEATRMEQQIDELQTKLQSTKMQLTSEMKLRNQSERELLMLKTELGQLKAKTLPRLDEDIVPKITKAPIYTHHSNGYDVDEPEFEPMVKKTSVKLTYREPEKDTLKLPPSSRPKSIMQQHGSLEEAFRAFASKNNGMEATGADIFKWSADAGVIGKCLNNHHVDISFSKVKPKGMKTITMKEMYHLIDELAVKYMEDTRLSYQGGRKRLIERLANAPFKLHGATHSVKFGGVDRLTDVTKYTGLHKERFEPKTGKGKGRSGKDAPVEYTGYVANYKLHGTYDKN